MPLWNTSTSPKWLNSIDKKLCMLTDKGWVLRHLKSSNPNDYWDEVLVALSDKRAKIPDAVNYYPAGKQYAGYMSPWGKGSLATPADYQDTLLADPATFPANSTIKWRWPTNQTPAQVWGYMFVSFGQYGGGNPSVPVTAQQANKIEQLTQPYRFNYSGSKNFNLLNECYLTENAGDIPVPPDHLFEVGFFLHTPAETISWNNTGTLLGDFTDQFGKTWRCRRHAKYITVCPPNYEDRLEGTIDFKAAFTALISWGTITGNEWFAGIGFGAEPVNGGGVGEFNISEFSVNYTPGAVSSPTDVDAETWFARMSTQPSANNKTAYTNFITGLKSDGIYQQLDTLYIPAGLTGTDAYKNVKGATYDLVVRAGTPTINSSGIVFDGASRLGSNFIPTTAAGQFTLNSMNMFMLVETSTGGTSAEFMGNATALMGRSASNGFKYRANDATTVFGGPITAPVMLSLTRAASTGYTPYIGNTYAQSLPLPTTTSTTMTASEIEIGRAGTASAIFTTSVFGWGASLTQAQEISLNTRLTTLRTALGL